MGFGVLVIFVNIFVPKVQILLEIIQRSENNPTPHVNTAYKVEINAC